MFQWRICTVALAVFFATMNGVDAQRTKLSKEALVLAENNNVFACNLYAKLKDQDNGNLFFSPYSISSALAMTYGGARNQTATQMADTLNFKLQPNQLHPAFGDLVKYLNATGKNRPYQLSVANALWGQEGYNFNPGYIKLVKDNYEAQLAELNFKDNPEAARMTINDWVEKKTNDKIKKLIPKGAIDPTTRLVLTNAIYFKSAWFHNFVIKGTKAETFTMSSGKKIKTPMMRKMEKTNYMKNEICQAVNIPYKGYGLSMIVFLPNKTDGLADLEKKMSATNVERWMKSMTRYKVDLKLPKFKMMSEFNLSKVLSSMGMPNAFTRKADFTGMSTQGNLYIQQVIHKAFVDVHEKGTEAAAATGVVVGVTSVQPNLRMATFHADHPFVFLIRENRTGSILFMGRVTEPKSK